MTYTDVTNKKKRNPQDSTLRNVRAANKKLDAILKLLKELKWDVSPTNRK